MEDWLFYFSQVLGWLYFFAWSFSFYGQVIENFRRKSVSGLSFDFELYNVIGFTGYSIYTIWGYVDKDMGTGPIAIQDIVFAVHACVLTVVTISQIFFYYNRDDPLQKVSHTCITIVIALVWGVLQIILIERALGLYDPHVKSGESFIFNSIVYMGWCKVFISMIKYIPQVISNYKRKSTIGWNIHNILLDFTGGALSFGQNIIDTFRNEFIITPDKQSASLNIAKFALSFVSMFFDIIFIIQHYVLYKDSNTDLKPTDEPKYEKLVRDA